MKYINILLIGLLALLSSCKSGTATGVELRIIFSDLMVDQVRVRTPDGAQMGVFPETPRAVESGETVVLLFPENQVKTIEFRVDALFQNAVVGSGSSDPITLMPNIIQRANIQIGAPAVCGDGVISGSGCDDGNTNPGDGCSALCEVEDGWLCNGVPSVCTNACPTGCDEGQRCTANGCVCDIDSCDGCCDANGACQEGDSAPACGVGGGDCTVCDAGDECNNGICGKCARECDGCCNGSECNIPSATACGVDGGACVGCNELRADSCSDAGDCACGEEAPCAVGQRCVLGQCICDAQSCAGCCDADNTCKSPTPEECGSGGSTCISCGSRSNSCVGTGACGCGGGPPCSEGQICDLGVCVCNSTSCPSGCCDDNGVCQSGSTLTSCGQGVSCKACGVGADTCDDSGTCACGGNSECGPGLACVGGVCECNSDSCDGCCDADGDCVALAATTSMECGSAGSACAACDSGSCDMGVCTGCASNCPSGCCNGETCETPSTVACGIGAAACIACDSAIADTCEGGQCVCGSTGAACLDSQRCVGGQCVCNDESCPEGCCSASGECQVSSDATCGINGMSCTACIGDAPNCNAGGMCGCGDSGVACGAGQMCSDQGICVCDPGSCQGCCEGNTCQPFSVNNCGATCGVCEDTANECNTDGECSCKDGPACDAGQRCDAVDGCVCDSSSCNGCCDGKDCRAGSANDACGSGGAACAPCAVGCVGGVCPSCSDVCPDGCCSGGVCITPPTAMQCGAAGGACSSCGIESDSCKDGGCSCGGGPECLPGQECVGGACVCTPTSCAEGCCTSVAAGSTCVVDTDETQCGVGGALCVVCNQATSNACVQGMCRCGQNPPCVPPGMCAAGSCSTGGMGI